jgi:hypothetical protein
MAGLRESLRGHIEGYFGTQNWVRAVENVWNSRYSKLFSGFCVVFIFESLGLRCISVSCPNCQSTEVSIIAAEVRLYRDRQRSLSHPPMTPAPDVRVCLDCGWSEFSVPHSWLAAGWLRPANHETAPGPQLVVRAAVAAAAS